MSKLYVFGIGGTGSRVLRSLAMLLASGVKLPNIETVIPIIIDPDSANGDFSRTTEIYNLYNNIRKNIHTPNYFFYTKVQTLKQSKQGGEFESKQIRFSVEGAVDKKFKQIIGENALDNQNAALKDMLFTKNNLEADLDVGFKGNPNIGSVVLNQVIKGTKFRDFVTSFSKGDKIFIINSIFGGTGAAGFPLLLKNIRESSMGVVSDSVIGAVTVLPYFNVKSNKESEIDSASFIDKTKSAMAYYKRAIIDNNSINSLYYIGDSPKRAYENVEGASGQKNDAHFVELASALALVDFCEISPNLRTSNKKAVNSIFKEFGVKNKVSEMTFRDLSNNTLNIIQEPLTRFCMSRLYLELGYEKAKRTAWVKDKESKTDKGFFNSNTYQSTVASFFKEFHLWLDEMANNDIAFRPFMLDVDEKNALDFISDETPVKRGLFTNNKTFDKFTESNNRVFTKYNSSNGINQLIQMLQYSSTNVLNDRFPKLMTI